MHKKKITPTGALLYVFLTVVLVFMMIPLASDFLFETECRFVQ